MAKKNTPNPLDRAINTLAGLTGSNHKDTIRLQAAQTILSHSSHLPLSNPSSSAGESDPDPKGKHPSGLPEQIRKALDPWLSIVEEDADILDYISAAQLAISKNYRMPPDYELYSGEEPKDV